MTRQVSTAAEQNKVTQIEAQDRLSPLFVFQLDSSLLFPLYNLNVQDEWKPTACLTSSQPSE